MCFICGRSSCCVSFHPIYEQEKYATAIELFEKAIAERNRIRNEAEEEENPEEEEENPDDSE